jgi:Zn-dependent M28 family amino/carboxypeptidase
MAEIVGTEHPEQVVVLGGHIDSWDVGQGAQDDGSGIMAALEAVNIIRRSGLKPKRTIRVVFWVNEENGTAGGRAYLQLVSRDLDNQVAAIEMDGGAEAPIGYGYGVAGANRRATPGNTATGPEALLTAGQQASLATLQQIANLLAPIGGDKISIGGGGTDIAPIVSQGVPGMSEMTTGAHYLDWHHSEADTLDKVDPADFRKNIASLAVMSFVLADMPGRLTGQLGVGE